MPGSVQNATPAAVLPQSLCTAFLESRAWDSRVNEYHDGSRQSSGLVASSRRSWALSKRLRAADLTTLWNFWTANQHDLLFLQPV